MARKPKTDGAGVDLGGADEANSAMSPIIGVAREDLLGAVTVMLRETASKPAKTLKHMQAFSGDVLQILTNKSEIAPDPKDKRFHDPAFKANPLFRMGCNTTSPPATASATGWRKWKWTNSNARGRALLPG